MRKYRNIKYNNIPRRVTKYSEEWIEYRKHRGSNSVKVEHCDINADGFDDSIVRDYRNPALNKLQTCGPTIPGTGPSSLSAALGKTSFGPSNLNAVELVPGTGPSNLDASPETSIVSTPGYVDYSVISFNFTYTGDFSAFTNYEYSLSTNADSEASFEANIVQTVNSSTQLINKLYSNLTPQTLYYVRVKATGAGGSVYSNFSSNTSLAGQISDPCTDFTATRVDDGDGTYTLTVTTNLAEESVFIAEALNNTDIRGLVRPLANDEFGNKFLAVVEGTGFDENAITTGGRGVFDAGFLKYRGQEWSSSYANNVYAASTPAQFPFLVNSIKYTSRQFNQTGKVLYLCDSAGLNPTPGKYDVTDFDSTIEACTGLANKTMDFWKDQTANASHYDWFMANDASETAQTYLTYLNQYDTIVYVSSATTGSPYFSSHFIEAIHTYMDQGGGLIGLNDHGVFQWNSNAIVAKFGFQFTGNVDRNSNATGANGQFVYQVSNILSNTEYMPSGYHPLFENVSPNARMAAGATEGVITYYDTATGMTTTVNPLPTALNSSYSSGVNKSVTITNHTDSANTDLGGGKLIVRTASGCGEILPAIP